MPNMLQGNICYAVCMYYDKRRSTSKEMETFPSPIRARAGAVNAEWAEEQGPLPEKADEERGQLLDFECVAGIERGLTLLP